MFTGIIEGLGTVNKIEREGDNVHFTLASDFSKIANDFATQSFKRSEQQLCFEQDKARLEKIYLANSKSSDDK